MDYTEESAQLDPLIPQMNDRSNWLFMNDMWWSTLNGK